MIEITRKLKLKLTDKQVQEVKDDILEWYYIKLTTVQIKRLLNKSETDSVLWKIPWSFDTVQREELMSLIGQDTFGRDWPIYGEISRLIKKKQIKFWQSVERKLKKKGYKLEEDWVDCFC